MLQIHKCGFVFFCYYYYLLFFVTFLVTFLAYVKKKQYLCTRKQQTKETMGKENTHTAHTATAAKLPAKWLEHAHANTIYVVHNEVHGSTAGGNINVGTDNCTAEQLAGMATEIELLRKQVHDLCEIIREYTNK